jgi:hypothetical protein
MAYREGEYKLDVGGAMFEQDRATPHTPPTRLECHRCQSTRQSSPENKKKENVSHVNKNDVGYRFAKMHDDDPAIFLDKYGQFHKLCSRQAKREKTRFKSKTGKPGFGHF